MKVPLFDLPYGEEEKEAVLRVLQSKWLSAGPETEAFETELAGFLGRRHAVLLNSCTAALSLAYRAVGVVEGCEVVSPSLTFVATASAARALGACVEFADSSGVLHPNISAATVEPVMTDVTSLVCFVHYNGYSDGAKELAALCRARGVPLVEDAAHGLGSEGPDGKPGSFGEVACFSFFANKNLATGEGGALVTDDEEIARKARLWRNHGLSRLSWERREGVWELDTEEVGYNFRATEITAALARVGLEKLPAGNRRRVEIVETYRRELAGLVEFPFGAPQCSANYIAPLLLPEGVDRRAFRERLAERGVQTSIHYRPAHTMTAYTGGETLRVSLPRAEEYGRRTVTLPLYPGMTEEQVGYVVESVRAGV